MKLTAGKYRIILENEAQLRKVAELRLSPFQLIALMFAVLLLLLALGLLLLSIRPIREMLPASLQSTQRENTVQNLLKLDSLQQAYDVNQAYLDNIATLLDTDRPAIRSVGKDSVMQLRSNDSLMESSEAERKFVASMQQRERYNLSIIAPIAAEGLIFSQPAVGYVVTAQTMQSQRSKIAIPMQTPIYALTEGTVVEAAQGVDGNWTVILQHPQGFLSKYSHMQRPLVRPGEAIESGQPISSGFGSPDFIYLEIWRNGDPLIPADFLSDIL